VRRILLKTQLSPGDVLMLTAAIRDLHRSNPGQFQTDVRTQFPELWTANPWITPMEESDPGVEVMEAHYPSIGEVSHSPRHFVEGYGRYLSEILGVPVRTTAFRGDVHLTEEERERPSMVWDLLGARVPYWLIDAGGKFDFTVKWWSTERWKAVVDALKGRVLFVQVGAAAHFHPRLRGVLDLRGMTTVRDLVHLVHHAEGVACPITFPMHLAAAVERPAGRAGIRPCVVVAGGREPLHWFMYPGHQVLHRVGALPCCAETGCWRARTVSLGDRARFDEPGSLCADVDVDHSLPRCMAMIEPDEVVRAVEGYLKGGVTRALKPAEQRIAEQAPRVSTGTAHDLATITASTARLAFDAAAKRLPEYPGGFEGRGIVMVATGRLYRSNAWIALKRLRATGCTLPVELWHWGGDDWNAEHAAWFGALGAIGVSYEDARRRVGSGLKHPWALKVYAMRWSRFREILYLDADQVVLVDPTSLFEDPEYVRTGAMFWPDVMRWSPDAAMWGFTGLPFRDEPEVQGGEAVLDKSRVWRELALTMWMNEQHAFFYRYMVGDKDSYRLCWHKLGTPYGMSPYPVVDIGGIFRQRDSQGRWIWQHRIRPKWSPDHDNPVVPGFELDAECRADLEEWKAMEARRTVGKQPGASDTVRVCV
jgi:ADP-heptose:LPS heptosyltransferase